MVDGAALLASMIHGLRAAGVWGERGTNLLDTGAWYYEVYETADGGYMLVRVHRAAVFPGDDPDHRAGRRRRPGPVPTRTTGRPGRP